MDLKKNIFQGWKGYIGLLTVAVIACWPLFFYCMKFDILDQYLPWRFLVGQCLQNGQLPLWNPYTHLGYPLHADPQSGAWYPVVWFIGGLFGYNIYWIHAEYVFHVWIAGIGMYLLCNELVRENKIAWLAGVSYMLCGLFTGNAQHLTYIISGAWIPLVLLFYLRMIRYNGRKDVITCTLCFFMLFTGGYPAFTIVMLYILMSLTIIVFLLKWKDKKRILQYGKAIICFVIALLLFSSVMLVSMAESFQLAGRAEGLSRELAMANPFSPQCMVSFLFPLSSLRDDAFFDTDISMSNGYFGLIMFAGVLLSFSRKKTKLEKICLAGSVFLLLCSMGSYTPLRGWLYDYFPLMNLFRMPSLFRLFAIIGFVILGSFALFDIYSGKTVHLKLVNLFKLFFVLVSITMIALFFAGIDTDNLIPSGYITWLQEIKLKESFIVQGIVTLFCLGLFIYSLKQKKSFSALLITDVVLASWLCAPLTLVSHISTSSLYEMTDQLPKGFRIPELTPMKENIDRTGIVGPLWCNLGIWKKQPILDGYNNFQTKQFLSFEQAVIAPHVLKNPLIYQSYSTSLHSANTADTVLIVADSTHLFLDRIERKNNLASLRSEFFLPTKLKKFTPTEIKVEVNNKTIAYLTLLQQNLPGWKVKIDDEETIIYESNGLFITILVPEGKHLVSYHYSNNKITLALVFSMIAIGVSLVLLWVRAKDKSFS